MTAEAARASTHEPTVIGSLAALAAGPAAWILQLSIDYAVSGHACFPDGAPRPAPPGQGWGPERLVLLAINLACLAIALAGGWVALSAWRRSGRYAPGMALEPLSVPAARSRFLAICGVMASAGFSLAILFDTALPYAIPSCWRFAP